MRPQTTLVTGGAGFIGANLAHRLLESGERVVLFDNLSRAHVAENVEWLRSAYGRTCDLVVADVRDTLAVREAVHQASSVFHFAAQVAVTTSLAQPTVDFEVNARGTLNVLEAVRAESNPPPVVFTSTNKVYGALDNVPLRALGTRYEPEDPHVRRRGIDETRPLDFHSPYGCSKGAADQYVRDYARTFGLRTVVFRMSCIYGPRQFGTEDQGWVAHLLMRAMQGAPITIYGDGRQVRDVLFVTDLVDALLRARSQMQRLSGMAFNIGGGPENAVSLLELLDGITAANGRAPQVAFEGWRTGDQRYYVSDTSRFTALTGWRPRVGVAEGLARLHRWVGELHRQGARSTHAESAP
jgi:CDP-paratose 2-epimerase